MTLKIINEGKGHKKWIFNGHHVWTPAYNQDKHWDESTMGAKFEEIGVSGNYGVFRTLYRCECGAEAVISEVGII